MHMYINDKRLVFTDYKNRGVVNPGLLSREYMGHDTLQQCIKLLHHKNNFSHVELYSNNIDELWEDACTYFELIEAAGGVVIDQQKMLAIFRHKKWDLPKGKIERNESTQTGAIREVIEECGLQHCHVMYLLDQTYHSYMLKGAPILKRTSWFMMQGSLTDTLTPQLDEDISLIRWFGENELDELYANTYSSISDLIKKNQSRIFSPLPDTTK
ncbi:MAG: NUDIX domain-containing protein [Bacteroidetes bacterium]|nr:NUDIX domain-containing protein [Bacteroidota bacterium]